MHVSCVRGRYAGEGESNGLVKGLESYFEESGFTGGGRRGISGSVAM